MPLFYASDSLFCKAFSNFLLLMNSDVIVANQAQLSPTEVSDLLLKVGRQGTAILALSLDDEVVHHVHVDLTTEGLEEVLHVRGLSNEQDQEHWKLKKIHVYHVQSPIELMPDRTTTVTVSSVPSSRAR